MVKSTLKAFISAFPPLYRLLVGIRQRLAKDPTRSLQEFLVRTSQEVKHPVFVKVGANDGLTGDPCGDAFLSQATWAGLLIEPVPFLVRKLEKIYSDGSRFRIAQLAIGPVSSQMDFHYVSPDAKSAIPNLPEWFDQLGSFDPSHIAKHLDGQLVPYVVTEKVNVEPLAGVFDRYGISKVDLLHIDTEGHDLIVLETLGNACLPSAILIEHFHLSQPDKARLKKLLTNRGYRIKNLGTDYFATLTGAVANIKAI
jgi:FkbM family methyltransferase